LSDPLPTDLPAEVAFFLERVLFREYAEMLA